MPIRLAHDSWLEEMAALRAEALATAIRGGMSRFESDCWDLLGVRVQVRVKLGLSHRGKPRRPTYHCYWFADGRRIGENALIYKIRKIEEKLK